MNRDELEQLCSEIRDLLVQTVSHNGGHLASNGRGGADRGAAPGV